MGRKVGGRGAQGPGDRPQGPRHVTGEDIEFAQMIVELDRENAERDLARYTELKGMARTPVEQAEYKGLRAGQRILKAEQKAADEDRQRLAAMSPVQRAAVERQEKVETARELAGMIQTMQDESDRLFPKRQREGNHE